MSAVLDERARQAAECHTAAAALSTNADDRRQQRNDLIRELRADDPGRWTYRALAEAVGCSEELVAAICQGRT